jgi:hypothetical protein
LAVRSRKDENGGREIRTFLYQNETVRAANAPILRALNPDGKSQFLTFRPYFDSTSFPFVERRSDEFFGCGRISRQDSDKYARNTLQIYEYFVAPRPKRGLFLGFRQTIGRKNRKTLRLDPDSSRPE